SSRGRYAAPKAQPARIIYARLLATENLEHVSQVGEFLAARRRPAADVIEDLAVLQAVIRDALDAAVLVEVDRDHALVDHLFGHERGLLGARGDVIEHLAADGRDRGRRAERNQHLLLRGAERNLFERALGEHIAALISLGEAAAQHQAERQRDRDGKRTSA